MQTDVQRSFLSLDHSKSGFPVSSNVIMLPVRPLNRSEVGQATALDNTLRYAFVVLFHQADKWLRPLFPKLSEWGVREFCFTASPLGHYLWRF